MIQYHSNAIEGYISRRATARLFDTTYQTIARWESLGKLPYESIKIDKAYYYKVEEIMAFKDTGVVAIKGAGIKKGTNMKRNKDAVVYTQTNEDDVYFVRKPRPVFEYPELLINFYQPARLNRLVTVSQLREAL